MFRRNPFTDGYCQARFRMMVLVTVLQGDLGVHYRQERIDTDFYGPAKAHSI